MAPDENNDHLHPFFFSYLKNLKRNVSEKLSVELGCNIFPSEHHVDFKFCMANKKENYGWPIPYRQTGIHSDHEKGFADWKKILILWLETIGRGDLCAEVWNELNAPW